MNHGRNIGHGTERYDLASGTSETVTVTAGPNRKPQWPIPGHGCFVDIEGLNRRAGRTDLQELGRRQPELASPEVATDMVAIDRSSITRYCTVMKAKHTSTSRNHHYKAPYQLFVNTQTTEQSLVLVKIRPPLYSTVSMNTISGGDYSRRNLMNSSAQRCLNSIVSSPCHLRVPNRDERGQKYKRKTDRPLS
ncbi:hypothetical protein J6590_000996 [Homalodisca vitripennis]|nr:hypothetical protein J6590_000996 [Homalodisca vitripennis]